MGKRKLTACNAGVDCFQVGSMSSAGVSQPIVDLRKEFLLAISQHGAHVMVDFQESFCRACRYDADKGQVEVGAQAVMRCLQGSSIFLYSVMSVTMFIDSVGCSGFVKHEFDVLPNPDNVSIRLYNSIGTLQRIRVRSGVQRCH